MTHSELVSILLSLLTAAPIPLALVFAFSGWRALRAEVCRTVIPTLRARLEQRSATAVPIAADPASV